MSTTHEDVSSAAVNHASLPAAAPDQAFAARWTAWQARGAARDRLVDQRALLVAIGTALMAATAVLVYTLMAS
jgi:hypothetical protein